MIGIAPISVEDYLTRSDKPACEYIDGVLHPKPVPTKLHGLIEFFLVAILRRQGIDAVPEVSVRLSNTRFLIPDVIAAPFIQSPYPTEPVTLCVEILSPEDRLSAAFAKCEEYRSWGVPYCWVIDPVKQTAWEYHAGSDPVRIELNGALHAGTLIVDLRELFAQASS